MFFLRKFLYAICLKRNEKKYRNAKNKSLDDFIHGDGLRANRFTRWWLRKMPLFLGGVDDGRTHLKLRKLELSVRHYGTFENFIAKSLAGFTFGVMLTYGLYFLFIFPLNFSFAGATLWCVIIGFISTLGLAFSEYFRSIALLSLPSFFSSKGRQALTTYAIILAVTGPGKNSLNNVRVLSDSIGCSQERVRKSLRDVFYLTKNPYVAIKQSLSVVISRIMDIAKKLKEMTTAIKKQVLAMNEVLIMASRSMNKVDALCQHRCGRLFNTCLKALNAAGDDCKVSLNCAIGGLCKSDHLSRGICSRYGKDDSICASPADTSNIISSRVQKKLLAFVRRLHNLLSFKLTKSHESHYELRKSHQVKDVVNAIATDIRELTGSILYLFDSISILFSFFYIYLFYSVITFRNKYLAHEWYENRYITSNLLLIEMKRVCQKKTTIFPLSRIERQKYIKINSLNLGTMDVYEMYNMIIKSVALFIKMSLHMAADYGLWWLIMECRRAANHVQVPEGMSNIEVETCKADGLSGQIYSDIANAFQPIRFNFTTDMTSCLPEPSAPDMKRNVTIMLIGVISVVIGFLEPYGRRLKVCIMNFYYPVIARRRAVWFYNHILRTRNTFTRGARRRLRRQYGRWDRKEPQATFLYRFRCEYGQKLPFFVLRKMVTPKEKYDRCILCKAFGAPDDPLTTCATEGCKGTYCLECFANLQNLCTICMEPLEYNDVSDMSEEKDSSEEEKRLRKEWVAKQTPDVFDSSCDSDAGSVASDDFDPKCVVNPSMSLKNCNLDELPTPTPIILDDKEKDWATLLDFELPKDELAQYAVAEQGIAMTLAHRIRTGFSGLIFAKPVFGRAVEPWHSYDTEVAAYRTSERRHEKPNLRREHESVPKKLIKFAKKTFSISPRIVAGSSNYDLGSPSASKRSFSSQQSNIPTTGLENSVRTLARGFKRGDRLLQVYYGLQMSDSDYKKLGRSPHSSYDMRPTESLSSAEYKKYTDESTRPRDTVSSPHCDYTSSWSPSTDEDTIINTQTMESDVEEDSRHSYGRRKMHKISTIPGRPSFRDIKIQPNKSQVTHQMFHVDDSD